MQISFDLPCNNLETHLIDQIMNNLGFQYVDRDHKIKSISDENLARDLKLPPQTIFNALQEGKLPFYKDWQDCRILPDGVEYYLRTHYSPIEFCWEPHLFTAPDGAEYLISLPPQAQNCFADEYVDDILAAFGEHRKGTLLTLEKVSQVLKPSVDVKNILNKIPHFHFDNHVRIPLDGLRVYFSTFDFIDECENALDSLRLDSSFVNPADEDD